jgi:uncharacterized membrane protein
LLKFSFTFAKLFKKEYEWYGISSVLDTSLEVVSSTSDAALKISLEIIGVSDTADIIIVVSQTLLMLYQVSRTQMMQLVSGASNTTGMASAVSQMQLWEYP